MVDLRRTRPNTVGSDRTSAVRLAIRRSLATADRATTGREVRVLVPAEALTSDDVNGCRQGMRSEHPVSGHFETRCQWFRSCLERCFASSWERIGSARLTALSWPQPNCAGQIEARPGQARLRAERGPGSGRSVTRANCAPMSASASVAACPDHGSRTGRRGAPTGGCSAEGEGAAGASQGGGEGGVGMAAVDDMRRIVRRASWRPEAVLRRLWARMRASWWHGWGLMARLRAAWRGR